MTAIIGLIGKKQSGKDTVARLLSTEHGFIRLAFADPLKKALYEIDPLVLSGGVRLRTLVDRYGWDDAKTYHEVRRLLQELGLAMRNSTYADVWLDATVWQIEALPMDSKVVISDVRFRNEAEEILYRGGYLWRIERPGVDMEDTHISENDLNDWPTQKTIANTGTIEDLRAKVKEALR